MNDLMRYIEKRHKSEAKYNIKKML